MDKNESNHKNPEKLKLSDLLKDFTPEYKEQALEFADWGGPEVGLELIWRKDE